MKRGYSHVLQGASLTLSSTSLEDSIRHCVLRLAWRPLSKGSEAAKFFIILTVLWSPADGRKNHSLPRVSPMPQFKICLFVDVKLWACLCFGVSGLKWTLWVCPHTETLCYGCQLGKPEHVVMAPTEGDIIARAASDLYRLDLRKHSSDCFVNPGFIWWWCSCILESFWMPDPWSIIINVLLDTALVDLRDLLISDCFFHYRHFWLEIMFSKISFFYTA